MKSACLALVVLIGAFSAMHGGFTRAIGGMLPSHHVRLLTSENLSFRDVSLSYSILSLGGPMKAMEHLQVLKKYYRFILPAKQSRHHRTVLRRSSCLQLELGFDVQDSEKDPRNHFLFGRSLFILFI